MMGGAGDSLQLRPKLEVAIGRVDVTWVYAVQFFGVNGNKGFLMSEFLYFYNSFYFVCSSRVSPPNQKKSMIV